MKKIVAIVIMHLCLFHIVLYAHENEHVHPFTLTGYAGELVKQNLKEAYSELWESKNNGGYLTRGAITDDIDIESGSFREDRTVQPIWDKYGFLGVLGEVPLGSMKCHFYYPPDGQGIDACPSAIVYQQNPSFYPNATWPMSYGIFEYAIRLYNTGDKEHAYFELGRVCHLLQDMSSPSHVEAKNHFWPVIDDPDYEVWWQNHYSSLDSYVNQELNNLTIKQITNVDDAMKSLAEETYRNVAIEGTLIPNTGNPASGDIAAMFLDPIDPLVSYINYVPTNIWHPSVAYWDIANVGIYDPSGHFANDWWEVPAIFGMTPSNPGDKYYHIANKHSFAKPTFVWDIDTGNWVQNATIPYSLAELWSGIERVNGHRVRVTHNQTKELITLPVEYTAGLMKYFYDLVNEPPYVKQVTVIQSGTCYDARWDWSQGQADRTLTPDTQQARNPQPVNDQGTATVAIEFSEAVKDVNISIDSVPLAGTLSQDSKSWIGTLSVNNLQTIGSGNKHLSIEAKDLTDQKLDGNPQSIAQYNPNSNQKEKYEDENGTGNSGGVDILHLWGTFIAKIPPTSAKLC